MHIFTLTPVCLDLRAVYRDRSVRGGLRRLPVLGFAVVEDLSEGATPDDTVIEPVVLWPGGLQPELAKDLRGYLGLAQKGDGIDWAARAAEMDRRPTRPTRLAPAPPASPAPQREPLLTPTAAPPPDRRPN